MKDFLAVSIFVVYAVQSISGTNENSVVDPFTQKLLRHLHRNTRGITQALQNKAAFGLTVQWKFTVPYDTFTPMIGWLSLAFPMTVPFDILEDEPFFGPFLAKLRGEDEEASEKRAARSDRRSVYQNIENFLEKLRIPGQSCFLRAICEVAEIPFDDDLLGDTLNTIFQASRAGRTEHPDEDHYYNNYIEAEMNGLKHGNCHQIYSNCSVSIFDAIPGMRHEIF